MKKSPTIDAIDFQESSTNTMLQYFVDPSWNRYLETEFSKPYFKKICSFLEREKKSGIEIFPPEQEIFSAFNLTPFDQVKVVLLGQDPYHDNGQAHGLAFSVKRNISVPPSLKLVHIQIFFVKTFFFFNVSLQNK